MSHLTNKRIFKFWAPLSATWLMMSVEGPLIAAVIARLAEPKLSLAAYGVAFAFALIIEAPVIMMLSASTALVQNRQSFKKLRRFTWILNGIITTLMLLILFPPVFSFILSDLMHLEIEIVRLIHPALFILIVWPGAIGYRRFYQGILIRYGFTRRVAYGTAVRLSTMAAAAGSLYVLKILPGASLGAVALSSGVLAEALASRLMVRDALKIIRTQDESAFQKHEQDLSYRSIIKFYYPLALTSILSLVIQPALTFFMGQGRYALESLAVWPVVNSFVFIFRSFGLSFQEAAISLLGENRTNYHKLKRFAQMIAGGVTFVIAVTALSSLLNDWMIGVSGLKESLAVFTFLPVQILILMPAFSVWISFQRAVLVVQRRTSPITTATSIEVLLVVFVMYALIFHSSVSAVSAAAAALLIGRSGSLSYLWRKIFKARAKNAENK